MRILGMVGVLAVGAAAGQAPLARAQYQEPVPIQSMGSRMPQQGYAAPSRFPTFGSPTMPVPAPQLVPMIPVGRYPYPPVGYAPTPVAYAPAPVANAPGSPLYLPGSPLRPVAWQQQASQPPVLPDQARPEGAPEKLQLPTAPPKPTPSTPPATPHVDVVIEEDGGPAEPAEPYMAAPEGNYKPLKGNSLYGSAEAIFWWLKAQPVPQTLTLSITNQLVGTELTAQKYDGARFMVGSWVNARGNVALEGGYFFLSSRRTSAQATFPGSDAAMIPIFNGINSESSTFDAQTSMWGAEINVRHQCHRFCTKRWQGEGFFDILGGFRYVDLTEDMVVRSTTSFATSPVLLSDALVTSNDIFGTHNQLFAGQIGAETGLRFGNVSARLWGKFAMGDNRQHVKINGFTNVSGPPVLGTFSTPGGFLTQPSNTGNFSQDVFSFMPEFGANVGYRFGEHVRVSAGYNFMYWYNVARPGDQIDTTGGGGSRLFFLGGGTAPAPTFGKFRETDFWAQGINLMVEVNY